jgi:predicted metal-dependent HD superfamily phosphohydrolase
MNQLLNQSWQRAWTALGAQGDGSQVRDALLAKYSEATRKYHSIQHLTECLAYFRAAQHLAAKPAEVEMALWFHDAIYDTNEHDNDEQSANWALSASTSAGVSLEKAERIYSLILVTKHTAAPFAQDEKVLIDIDLSILVAEPARFAEYESQIRAEYSFAPEPLFRCKRSQILRSFFDRPAIYSTEFFHGLLERQARTNLSFALDANARRSAD